MSGANTETQLCFGFILDMQQEEASAEKTRLQKLYKELVFFAEPKNDNEKLLNLQYEYRHGKEEALSTMHKKLEIIAKKIIKTESRKKHFELEDYEIEEKAQNAADYIIVQYLKRADFAMLHPTSYLYLRVKHELYYQNELEKNYSFIRICEENEREIDFCGYTGE